MNIKRSTTQFISIDFEFNCTQKALKMLTETATDLTHEMFVKKNKRTGILKGDEKASLAIYILLFVFFVAGLPVWCSAQQNYEADTTHSLTLQQCIQYGLQHQPAVKESEINVSIARLNNSISLAGWLPQLNSSGTLTHYLQLPTSFVPNTANPNGNLIKEHTGIANTFVPGVSLTQVAFEPQLLYAVRSAPLYIKSAEQSVDSSKIYLVSNVTKSFYSLLFTIQEINVLKEDTARLNKSLSDAYRQYIAGTVDETDYDEAGISLNNSLYLLKQAIENVRPAYDSLKHIIGFPPQNQFNIVFDTTQMTNEIGFDTTQELQFQKRIEVQQLQTQKQLAQQLTDYYKIAWLPTVSGFFDYNLEFENNNFGSLFSSAYPYSYIGLSFNIPIFTGFARIHNIQKSQLTERLIDWGLVDLKSAIYTQYSAALAAYKSNLYEYNIMKDNVDKAKRVYGIVSLQYREGVVPYLNVITAEDNLIASEIGYINALFSIISSKVDLQTAMGIIQY